MKLTNNPIFNKFNRPFRLIVGAAFLSAFTPHSPLSNETIRLSKDGIQQTLNKKEPNRETLCKTKNVEGKTTIEINALFSEHRLLAAQKYDKLINDKKNSSIYRELIYRMIHRIDQSQKSDDMWLVDIDVLCKRVLSLQEKEVLHLLEERQLHSKEDDKKNEKSEKFEPNFTPHASHRHTKHTAGKSTISIKHLPYSQIKKSFEKLPLQLYSSQLGTLEDGKSFHHQATHLEGMSQQVVHCIKYLAQEFKKSDYSGKLLISGGTEGGHSGATDLKERNAVGGDMYHFGKKSTRTSPLKSWHGLGLSFDLLLTKSTCDFMKKQYGIKEIGKIYEANIGGQKVKILLHDSEGADDNHATGLHYHIQMSF